MPNPIHYHEPYESKVTQTVAEDGYDRRVETCKCGAYRAIAVCQGDRDVTAWMHFENVRSG